ASRVLDRPLPAASAGHARLSQTLRDPVGVFAALEWQQRETLEGKIVGADLTKFPQDPLCFFDLPKVAKCRGQVSAGHVGVRSLQDTLLEQAHSRFIVARH